MGQVAPAGAVAAAVTGAVDEETVESCPVASLDPALEREWRKLVSEGNQTEPFYQPDWFRAFASLLCTSGEGELVTVRNSRGLLAVLPVMKRRTFLEYIPARCLRSLSNVHSCRFDIIAAGDPAPALASIWRHLKSRDDWDVIEALDVPDDGLFDGLVEIAAGDGYPAGQWPTRFSPYIIIEEAASSAHARKKEKGLARLGSLEFLMSEDPAKMKEFIELEAAGWKAARGSAIGLDPGLVTLYRFLAEAQAARGHLIFYTLSLDARPIAMHFGIIMGNTYYSPKIAYDESLGKYSPGLVLIRRIIDDLRRRGVERYDMLGARTPWKCRLTSRFRRHSNCYIFTRGIKGYLLYALGIKAGLAAKSLKHRMWGDPQAVPESAA